MKIFVRLNQEISHFSIHLNALICLMQETYRHNTQMTRVRVTQNSKISYIEILNLMNYNLLLLK